MSKWNLIMWENSSSQWIQAVQMANMNYIHDTEDLGDMLCPDIYIYIFHDKCSQALKKLETYKSLEAEKSWENT